MSAAIPSSPLRLSGVATSPVICQTIDIDKYAEDPAQRATFDRVASALRSGKRIIVVTGAGISVSSGIPVGASIPCPSDGV